MRLLTYLACPYNHPDPAVRKARFEAATRAAVQLMWEGHTVFSPITHSHPMTEVSDTMAGALGWEFWKDFDTEYLKCSHTLVVLQIEGWDKSPGVRREIEIAEEMGMSIRYLDHEGGTNNERLRTTAVPVLREEGDA